MPPSPMLRRLAVTMLFAIAPLADAAIGDADFLAAREAFQKGQTTRIEELAPRLQDHPLSPWVEYWQLRMRLPTTGAGDVQGYLERYAGQLPANRLRADWLRLMGKQRNWPAFRIDYPKLRDPETDLQCLSIQARLAAGGDEDLAANGRALWLTGRELPDACTPVFDALTDAGHLREADVWARVRLAFEAGNATVAKAVALRLPSAHRPDPKAIDAVIRNPQKFLEAKNLAVAHRGQREVALFALGRTAVSVPEAAANAWRGIGKRLPADDRNYGWGLIATAGARKHLPTALAWFQEAGETPLSDAQLAWKARAALRAADWPALLSATEAMQAEEKDRAAWRYWRGRALIALDRTPEANAVLAALAQESDFHGQLAQEELGPSIGPTIQSHRPTEEEVAEARQTPGFRRALAFYRLGLRYEGNLEWIWTVSGLDDTKLLAAAELARREGWYERAIATADRSKKLVNMDLRYPAPYPELIRASARELDLDEAWVYGLVRQESRFVATARSSVGASGLMQIMPGTARWIAGKLGVKDWRPAVEDAVDANVSFGTFYLKEMLTRFNGSPVLASAAYNAGPGRAQNWRGIDSPLEGAIYIDTIPFNETRDYVRKVMANAAQYARVLGHPPGTLKARIGTVPPRATAAPAP